MDGAVRPIHRDCIEMPLAAGAVIHVYVRDEVVEGYRVRQIMRHHQIVQVWARE